MSAEAFVHDLLRAAPELKPILDEHLAANDTLLPHVIMADVVRFAVAEMQPAKMPLRASNRQASVDGNTWKPFVMPAASRA